jgi:hypothetical protein
MQDIQKQLLELPYMESRLSDGVMIFASKPHHVVRRHVKFFWKNAGSLLEANLQDVVRNFLKCRVHNCMWFNSILETIFTTNRVTTINTQQLRLFVIIEKVEVLSVAHNRPHHPLHPSVPLCSPFSPSLCHPPVSPCLPQMPSSSQPQ